MELNVEHTLARLFAVTRVLLHAGLRTKDVPEAYGAIMTTRDEREARYIDGKRRHSIQMSKHRVRALSYRCCNGSVDTRYVVLMLQTCQYVEDAYMLVFMASEQ